MSKVYKIRECLLVVFLLLCRISYGSSEIKIPENFQIISNTQEAIDIVDMLSSQVKSNYDRISTWQGTIKNVDSTYYYDEAAEHVYKSIKDNDGIIPNKLMKTRSTSVNFATNLELNQLYSNRISEKPMQFYQENDTDPFERLGAKPFKETSIVTQDQYLRFSHNTMYGASNYIVSDGVKGRVAFREPTENTENLRDIIDPRDSMKYATPIYQELGDVLNMLKNNGPDVLDGYKIKVEEGTYENIVFYRVQFPLKVREDLHILKTMLLSSDKGYNIISLKITHGEDGKLRQEKTWDYILNNGTWVPSKMRLQLFDIQKEELKFERIYDFEESIINETIPPETFTYKNLGLENGERFIDTILRKEYIYNDGDLIAASNMEIIQEASDDVLDGMLKDSRSQENKVSKSIDVESSSESNSSLSDEKICIPDQSIALNEGRPFVLDLHSRTLIDPNGRVDAISVYNYLTKAGKGDLVWDGGFLVATRDTIIYEVNKKEKPLSLIFGKYTSGVEITTDLPLPYTIVAETKEGKKYLMTIQKRSDSDITVESKSIAEKDAKKYQPCESTKWTIRLNTVEDFKNRDIAATELLKLGNSAVPALVACLESKHKDVPLLAAEALGKMGSDAKDAVPILSEAFENGNGEAGIALGKIGPEAKSAVQVLITSLNNKKFKQIAIRSLGRIGPEAKNAILPLTELLNTSNEKTIVRIHGALAKITGNEQHIVFLTEYLDDNYARTTRIYAVQELEEIGPSAQNAIPALERVIWEKEAVLSKLANQALDKISCKN